MLANTGSLLRSSAAGVEMGMGKQHGMQESQVCSFIHLVMHSSNKDANIEVIANQGICKMLRICKRSK